MDENVRPERIAPVTSGFGDLGRSLITRLQCVGLRVAATTRGAAGERGLPSGNGCHAFTAVRLIQQSAP
jgi:hypothetical protein